MNNNSLYTTFLLLLFLALSFNNGWCETDFCDGDPRIRTIENKCPGDKHVIRLQYAMSGNPNHALHDLLWPISHYLQNCARGELTFLSRFPRKDITQCLNRSHVDPWTIPAWATCVGIAMIEKLGSNYSFKFESEERLLNGNMKTCYRTETVFGVKPTENGFVGYRGDNFRHVDFYGRNITGKKEVTYNESSLIRLPEEFKVKAFQFMKNAVYKKYGINHRRREPFWNAKLGNTKIRVIVYDRNDTNRRQWANPSVVTQVLDLIEDVDYKFLRSIPKPFIDQVELFSWADIVIAPYGAGMANTIFMKEGTDIIEIWKYCLHNTGLTPKQPREWTGWHARLLGINLTYAQCHVANLPFKESKELIAGRGPENDGLHKVRGEEIFGVFREALERQRDIIRNTRNIRKKFGRQHFERMSEMDSPSIEGNREIDNLYSNERLVYVLAACFALLIMRLLFRIRAGKTKPPLG